SNPVRAVDPTGLDFWVEGPTSNDQGGLGQHQKVCVGTPNQNRVCISFGAGEGGSSSSDPGLKCALFHCSGQIYWDTPRPGAEGDYYNGMYQYTTAEVDDQIKQFFTSLVGYKNNYSILGDAYCRSFSQRTFNYLEDHYPSSSFPIFIPMTPVPSSTPSK